MKHFYQATLILLLHFISTNQLVFASQSPNKDLSFSLKPAPEWVIKSTYNYEHKLTAAQPSQYLLIDTQIKLYGTPQDYFRYVIKPLTSIGITNTSEIKIKFNPAFEKLTIHNIHITRNNKLRDATKTSKIRLIQQEDDLQDNLLGGKATAVIILENILANDIIDYQYTITGRNPVFGNQVFGSTILDWGIYIDQLKVRLLTEKNRPLHIKIHNDKIRPVKATLNKRIEYSLNKSNIAPIVDEQEYPHDYSPYSWLQYTEYKDWGDVSKWGAHLYKNKNKTSNDLKKIARKIKSESGTDEEFIINALSFVQNKIRYLGLEFGENSHKPHQPDEVLRNGFGDCKDKSLLLNSILSQYKIKAYPALVSTSYRNAINNQLASPGIFNHVISYVIYKGKAYWLDGTKSYQAGNLRKIGVSDYGYALIIGNKKLTKMYKNTPVTSKIDVKENIYAKDFNGSVTYNITTTYYRNAAEYMRYTFANSSIDKIQLGFSEYLRSFYSNIKPLKKIKYTDDYKNNRFIINEYYKVNDFWKQTGKKLFSNLYVFSFVDYLKAPKVKERNSPLHLGSTKHINHITSLHYPEDIDIKLDSKPVTLKSNSIEYRYSDSYANNTYSHKASLKILNDRVETGDITEHLELVKNIKKDWRYNISFIDPTRVTGYREIISLKKRLQEMSK
jgi:hypothetical protein